MKNMIQKHSISQNCLVQRIISRFKIINKMILYVLLIAGAAFVWFIFSEQTCLSKGKMPLLTPSTITQFERTGFYNDGRQWNYNATFMAFIKNRLLFVTTDGSDEGILLFTAPGEYENEKKIIILGQKYLVIEFDKPIKNHIIFNVKVIMDISNELRSFDHAFDCFNKSIISVPLSPKGRTIHYFLAKIKGEKATFGVKSIFLE